MIEALAERTAYRLKQINPEKTASTEVMKFGMIMAFNGSSVLFISLLIGWLGGKFSATLVTLIAFAVIRFFSGGFHFKSAWMCIMFSSALMIVIPYVQVEEMWGLFLTVCSLVLVLIYAPSRIEEQTRIPKKHFVWLRWISVIIVSTNFLVLSPILTLVFFTQSIMLVKLKGVKA